MPMRACARLMEIALQLEGLYRHASTHAAGVVIGDRPLDQLVPLYKDPRSELLVTQYSMKYVEQAGLVKFDFLGLTTLTIIDRALKFLRDQGIELDIVENPAGRQEDLRDDLARRHRRRVHLRNRRAIAARCSRCARTGSRTSSPSRR